MRARCPRCNKIQDATQSSSSRTPDETAICDECGAEQAANGLQRPGNTWGPLYDRILWDIVHSEWLLGRLMELCLGQPQPNEVASDLHEEEEHAEGRQYILWCEGKLGELAEAGLMHGKSELTEAGWAQYRNLIASSFVPSKEKVIWTLQSHHQMPAVMVERVATLMFEAV
jgi:hypothetical protein